MVKITVLMPVYNAEKYLKEAIESVLNQSFTDFEFIIINDCSSDDSKSIICSFHDSRIKYFENTDNLGVANSLNQGLSLAQGDYIVRMDSDDIALPDRFEKLIFYMNNHPDVSICGSWIEYIGLKKEKHLWFTYEEHNDIKTALLFGNAIAHPAVILKRDIFLKNQEFYNPLFSKSEDYELWTRLIFKLKFANLQESLLKYRLHDEQSSKKIQYIGDDQVERIKQQYQKGILKKIGLDISYMDILEDLRKKDIKNYCKTKILIETMSKNAFNKNILLSGMNFNRNSFYYMRDNIDVGVNQIAELLINIFCGSEVVLIGYGTLGKKIHNVLLDKINFCAIADKNISEDGDICNLISKLDKCYKYTFLMSILSIDEHIKIEKYIKINFEHSTIIGFISHKMDIGSFVLAQKLEKMNWKGFLMKVFIVNLAQDELRRKHMKTLIESLGLSYEFINAIYGKSLSNITDYVEKGKEKSISLIGRELVPGEIGCILSHHLIYNKMIENHIEMALILEDDIEILSDINHIIAQIKIFKDDWDVVLLGYHGVSSRAHVDLSGIHVKDFNQQYQIKQLAETAHGTYGYVISLEGAKKILKQSVDFILPIDHYTGDVITNNVYGVYPQVVRIKNELSDQSLLTVEREELRQKYRFKKVYKYYELLKPEIDKRATSQIILYGFNDLAKLIYLKYHNDIHAILDQQKYGQWYENMKVMTIDEIKINNFVFIICAINSNAIEEITNIIMKYYKEATIISWLEPKRIAYA